MAVLVARTRGGGVRSLAEFPAPRGAQRCVGAPAPQVAYEVDEAPWQRELRDVTCFFFFFSLLKANPLLNVVCVLHARIPGFVS